MSAHTRKHLTNSKQLHPASLLYVIDNNVMYAIPKKVAKKYIVETKKAIHKPRNISADEFFEEFDKKHTKAGALLKGLRTRENLSQTEFAKKINVSQVNLSKMENGKRPIGKTIAKRIEKAFHVNYRYFLE